MARLYKNKTRDSITLTQKDHPVSRQQQEDRYRVSNNLAQLHSDAAMDRVMDIRDAYYAGLDPRRRQEAADAGMIREDHNAMANLPRMAQHHQWPTVSYYQNMYVDSIVEEE